MAFPLLLSRYKNLGGMAPGGVSLLPFTDTFTRADGDLDNNWEYSTGIWAVATNAAVGAPTDGANTVVNGTFDTDANWSKGTGWTIDTGDNNKATHAAGSASNLSASVNPNTVGLWYRRLYTILDMTAGNISCNMGGSGGPLRTANNTYSDTLRQTTNGSFLFNAAAAYDGSVDNVSCYPLTAAHLLASRDFQSANVDISVNVTIGSGYQAGIVARLDSQTAPANFLLAYHNGTQAVLLKCLAGVYTSLISSNAAYAAGRTLRLVCNGVSISLYYNGVQIGTTQTLVAPGDNAVINGTRHGMFSTGGSSTLDAYIIVAV